MRHNRRQGWGPGCQRGELADRLKDIVPILPGLGRGDWLLPAIDGIKLKIHMEFENPDLEIKDVEYDTSESVIHTKPAIIDFVQKFYDINKRWGNWYEPVTESIINICVKMQEDLLKEHQSGNEPLLEMSLIIASALRILGLCHNIAIVEHNLRPLPVKKFYQLEMFMEPEDVSIDQNPSIVISRHEMPSSTFAESDGTLLATLIRDLIRKTQHLVLHGRFWELPILLCVLCLLNLIQISTMCCPKYIDLPELEPHFEFVWKSLCRLYDAASEGHNPLVNVWDKTEYAALVGPHTVALKHFEALNPLWVESGHQEYDGNDGFYRLLDSFIAGYEISINEDEDA